MKRPRKVLTENDPIHLGDDFDNSQSGMGRVYNYYTYHHDVKDARKWVTKYLKANSSSEMAADFEKVPTMYVPMWVCVNCRLMTHNIVLLDEDRIKTHERLSDLIAKYSVVEEVAPVVSYKEVINQACVEFDDTLDEFYRSDYKNPPPEFYKRLKDIEAKPSDLTKVRTFLDAMLFELTSDEPECLEYYDHLTKKQKKAYIAYVNAMLHDVTAYCSTERKVRKVAARKVKPKSPDKIAAKVQFKAEDTSLKIASLPPAKIVGAQSVWLYNTKYKILTFLVAPSDKKLTIKGTTVVDFDPKLSLAKTLRKPEAMLKEITSLAPMQATKYFQGIATKPQRAVGRLNKDMVILRKS
jgi:hypothetical protein